MGIFQTNQKTLLDGVAVGYRQEQAEKRCEGPIREGLKTNSLKNTNRITVGSPSVRQKSLFAAMAWWAGLPGPCPDFPS